MENTPIAVNIIPNQNPSADGFFNDINDFQYDILQKFKQNLMFQKVIDDMDNNNDLFLLRFLRARKFDLDKATLMYYNYRRWRVDNNIDNIEMYNFPEIFDVKRVYPHTFHKTDKFGRPIFIELLSKLNTTELFMITTEERLLNYFIKENERTMKFRFSACSQTYKKIIEQFSMIIDVEGVTTSLFNSQLRELLKMSADLGQNYYPECVYKIYLINTPFLFSSVWTIIKPLFDKKTRKKFIMEGKNFKPLLLENIYADDLPSFLGGNCICAHIQGGCLCSDIGPWNPNGGIKNCIFKI